MRSFICFGVGALGIGLVAGLGWWAVAGARIHPALPPHGVLVCPSEIDLGTVEIHQTTEAVLTLTNTGGGPLSVTGVTTDCGCLGIRLLPEYSEILTTTTVVIPAGGKAQIAFPMRASGVHGTVVNHLAKFHTDDPDRPEVRVRLSYRPVAWYFADPMRLVFDDIRPDQPAVAMIGLYTTKQQAGATFRQVVSSHPDQVRATIIPDSADAPTVSAEGLPETRRFAQLRVEVAGLRAAESLDAWVRVLLDGPGDPTLHIPLSARAQILAELAPSSIIPPPLVFGRASLVRHGSVPGCRDRGR